MQRRPADDLDVAAAVARRRAPGTGPRRPACSTDRRELQEAEDRRASCGCRSAPSGRRCRSSFSRSVKTPLDADLVLGLAEERLLARGADEVRVEVAVADVVERPLAAELLVAGRDVDRGVRAAAADGRAVVVEVACGRRRRRRSRAGRRPRGSPRRSRARRGGSGCPSSERIVRSVSASSPSEYAALSLSRPWPGMSTSRSRGSDIIAVAPALRVQPDEDHRVRARRVAAAATSIFAPVVADDEDRLRLAGRACLSCERTCTASGTLSSLMIVATSLTSSSTADARSPPTA